MAASFTGRARAITNLYAYGRRAKRVVPIDMGANELSPPYVLRILRQFGFTDEDIEVMVR